MSNSMVAKRYALALFQLSKENNLLAQVEQELRVVKEVLVNSSDLNAVLQSPKVSAAKKKEIIKDSFSQVNPFVLNTLMILIDRHRQDQMVEVVDQFVELSNEEHGIADAKVYSIRPLTQDESDALSASFAAEVGKKSLRIQNIVDPELLGGLKIRIGNRIYDGSLRGKLNRLERKLLG
ncbi:MAG: F0F1 ATP synthase subunit delta [Mesobacillus sp.]|jgi:F-type H+-transporting ATPase subunit delta|uniref:F0F1 ATP synthase subunit delta n=1 Tax=Mesobacillus sp. TaxID=2675271 RepID=UPI003C68755A